MQIIKFTIKNITLTDIREKHMKKEVKTKNICLTLK